MAARVAEVSAPALGGHSTATILLRQPVVAAAVSSNGGAQREPRADLGTPIYGPSPPTPFARMHVSCASKIGRRKKQEDRAVIVPSVLSREDVSFLGIFDGTVGEHAADFVHTAITEHVCGSKHFREAVANSASPTDFLKTTAIRGVQNAMLEGYAVTDERLVAMCRERHIDYSACTAVTVLLAGHLLTVAHLGDSKVVLGREDGPGGGGGHANGLLSASSVATTASGASPGAVSASSSFTPTAGSGGSSVGGTDRVPFSPGAGAFAASSVSSVSSISTRDAQQQQPAGHAHALPPAAALSGKYLTADHKPDHPDERRRIEACGGSLTYLHGGKPFIRGGDFTARQALGDRPMQLNYSRAFGGKDLKNFGLSSVPDILQIALTPSDRVVILGSDGLWDVVTADGAVRMAWDSFCAGRDAADDLADFALNQHDTKGTVDNVTVIVCVLKWGAAPAAAAAVPAAAAGAAGQPVVNGRAAAATAAAAGGASDRHGGLQQHLQQ